MNISVAELIEKLQDLQDRFGPEPLYIITPTPLTFELSYNCAAISPTGFSIEVTP